MIEELRSISNLGMGKVGKAIKSITFNNKKGQEEIMGFMLVILLVVVIGMTVLFLFKPAAQNDERDSQIDNLLYSVLATSVDGQSIGTRIEECGKEIGCEEMGNAIEEVMETAFLRSGTVLGQNLKGYKFNIEGGGVNYLLEKGNSTGVSKGTANVIGDNIVKLVFYY